MVNAKWEGSTDLKRIGIKNVTKWTERIRRAGSTDFFSLKENTMVFKEAKIKNVTNWELGARKMGGVPHLAAGNAFLPSQKLPLQVKEEEEDGKPV